jgi:uncharacterized protein (TIGR00288 family)
LEHKLCVLIDFENIAAGTEKEGLGRFDIRAVIRRMTDKGRILVNRSYGDWGRFAKFKQRLLEQGVQMVELTSYRGQDKNRADIALVVDAMEIAFTRDYIDTFVLLSGDSDFTPLVMRLKELDRRVIGIGTRGSSSRLLVESCDEFIFYESLLKKNKSTTKPEPEEDDASSQTAPTLSKRQAFDLLVETLSGIQKDEPGPVLGGLIKQSMLRKAPAFDETDYGFAGFARFLEGARDKRLVTLNRDERAGGYRVDSADAQPPAPAPSPGPAPSARNQSRRAEDRREEEEEDDLGMPELEGEAARLYGLLQDKGHPPVSHMLRHTVVHEFIDHVSDRERRKKRNTLMYVYGDIARRCRKTDPYVPPRHVRTVINTLKAAGELRHSSGGPVRSNTAHFIVTKDAEELLVVLRKHHIRALLELGEPLRKTKAVSQLLWNDDAHATESRTLIKEVRRALKEEGPKEAELPKAVDETPVPTEADAPAAAAEE